MRGVHFIGRVKIYYNTAIYCIPWDSCLESLTYSMNKKLWFCWEVVVDHIVQHRDVNSTRLVMNG